MHTVLASLLAPQGGAGGGLTILMFQVVAIGAVFYLLIIRPQSQARKKHQAMLAALKKNDEVTTAGGLIGKVKDVKEDRVTIETGSATLVVDRSRIIRVGDTVAPGTGGP